MLHLLLIVLLCSIELARGLTLVETERNALLQFKKAMTYSTCFTTTNNAWSIATNPCDPSNTWSRVVCSGGSVVELDFAFCSLTGTISPALSALANLSYVDFSYNSLYGSIPSTFGLLPKLNEVYMNNNALSGSIPSQIFIPSLDRIDFSYNQLSGVLPAQISTASLVYADLSNNHLSGVLPTQLGLMTSTYILNLNNNVFSGAISSALKPLCPTGGRKIISLSCNLFTSDASSCLSGVVACAACPPPSVPTTNNTPRGQCTGYIAPSKRPASQSQSTPAFTKSQSPLPHCPGLPVFPANTDVPGTCVPDQLVGTTCKTACSTGYARVSGAVTAKCNLDQTWSKITVVCKLKAT